MGSIILLLTSLLTLVIVPTASAGDLAVASAVGPPPSFCLPPRDSATTPRRQIGSVSYQPPPGYNVYTSWTDQHIYEKSQRYFGISDHGTCSFYTGADADSRVGCNFYGRSDFNGRVSCKATINGRSVTVTTGTIELERSHALEAPGVIGMQSVVVAEWDQDVDGHRVIAFGIARAPEALDDFRATLYSVRIAGDSITPTMTLAQLIPHWAAVRVDTIAGLELETQTMGGSARFVARSVGGDVAVTTPELEPDSVRAWSDVVESLAKAPSPGVHALGSSVAATATNVGGKPAVAVSFAEETSDAQVSLALTPSDATRLAGALRAAMAIVKPTKH